MKARAAWLILLIVCALCEPNKLNSADHIGLSDAGTHIVLPDPDLMKCSAVQFWQGDKVKNSAVYPAQVSIDHFDKRGCPQGIVALYNKTVSEDDLRAALDQGYSKWAIATSAPPVRLWRVEPEKFAIQLTTIRDSIKEQGVPGEEGMKQVIYLAFRARAAH
jgi:hypothetical protein